MNRTRVVTKQLKDTLGATVLSILTWIIQDCEWVSIGQCHGVGVAQFPRASHGDPNNSLVTAIGPSLIVVLHNELARRATPPFKARYKRQNHTTAVFAVKLKNAKLEVATAGPGARTCIERDRG